MSRIRVLPDHLINQIAAGEVIERPASVVKELLENALDAGAREISLQIEGGGRRRIRVADDGEGLDHDDSLLAFERHATSKLAASSDLGRIVTLGFRGEALPAIAAVSRLTLQSSRGGEGTRVEVEAGRIKKVTEAGHPKGTTIDVRDLFFNTPARAKFLKAPATELGHISDLVAAYCVTIPQVKVTLSHEGRSLIEVVPVAGDRERIRQSFGPEWGEAIPIQSGRGALSVRGLILPPLASASTRRMQHLYVNGRLVKDRLVSHAIASASEAFLPNGRHAAVFLFIACPPEAVDVNVHPAKAEVRFGDSRIVHDLVQSAVLDALRSALPITALQVRGSSTAQELGLAGGEALAASYAHEFVHEATQGYLSRMGERIQESGPFIRSTPALPAFEGGAVALAHYKESYIVAADGEGLLLIDQHAAHERILFERLLTGAEGEETGRKIQRQKLLFPVTITLPRSLRQMIQVVTAELERLGFAAEPFGAEGLVVREVPAVLEMADPVKLLNDLIEQIPEESGLARRDAPSRREKLLATVACHAAIKVRMSLTLEKMNYLIRELFRTASPLKCPHGRPAVVRFSQVEIERSFDRK